ncbi:unnamed protein product, partial [Ectocarpus fasciculatus]
MRPSYNLLPPLPFRLSILPWTSPRSLPCLKMRQKRERYCRMPLAIDWRPRRRSRSNSSRPRNGLARRRPRGELKRKKPRGLHNARRRRGAPKKSGAGKCLPTWRRGARSSKRGGVESPSLRSLRPPPLLCPLP